MYWCCFWQFLGLALVDDSETLSQFLDSIASHLSSLSPHYLRTNFFSLRRRLWSLMDMNVQFKGRVSCSPIDAITPTMH